MYVYNNLFGVKLIIDGYLSSIKISHTVGLAQQNFSCRISELFENLCIRKTILDESHLRITKNERERFGLHCA